MCIGPTKKHVVLPSVTDPSQKLRLKIKKKKKKKNTKDLSGKHPFPHFFDILALTYGPGPYSPGPLGPYGPGPLIVLKNILS